MRPPPYRLRRELRKIGTVFLPYRLRIEDVRLSAMARRYSKASVPHQNFLDGVLVLPPASEPGSLGDEAMLVSISQELMRSKGLSCMILEHGHEDSWGSPSGYDKCIHIFRDITHPNRQELIAFIEEIRRFRHFVVVGADVLDGWYSALESYAYLRLASLAASVGVHTRILGFSWPDKPARISVQAMRKAARCVELRVRDPQSLARLRRTVPKAGVLVADVAFLLQPSSGSQAVCGIGRWTDRESKAGRDIMAFNCSWAALGVVVDGDRQRLLGFLLEGVKSLLAKGNVSLLMIPHDFRRDNKSDLALLRQLQATIEAEHGILGQHVLLPPRLTASEVKGAMKYVDFAFSCRMHLAIAALGQGVPVASVPYHGKFEGLHAHFGLEGMLLTGDDFASPDRFREAILVRLGDAKMTRKRVRSALADVMSLASRNFSGLT